MAKSGRVYVFGKDDIRLNPIHRKNLALFCLKIIEKDEREYDVGGPNILTVSEIDEFTFQAQNKASKIT